MRSIQKTLSEVKDMKFILIIIGIYIACGLCGALSNRPGIIGFIANLLWYLWRKFWALVLIIIVIWLVFVGIPSIFV